MSVRTSTSTKINQLASLHPLRCPQQQPHLQRWQSQGPRAARRAPARSRALLPGPPSAPRRSYPASMKTHTMRSWASQSSICLQHAGTEAAPPPLPPPSLPPLTSRLAPPLNRPPKNIRAGAACTRTAWLRAWLLSAPRQTAALDRAATRAAAVQDAIAIGSKCGWFAGPQRGASDWGRPSAAQQQGQRPKLAGSMPDHGLGLPSSVAATRRATMAAARVGRQARCSSAAPRPLAATQQAVGDATSP